MVFLILAAQYEKWSLPLSVLLAMPFGTFGALAAHSFHETKNLTCGEGGALVINAPRPPDDPFIYETAVEQCVLLGDGSAFALTARFLREGVPLDPYANHAEIIWKESTNCSGGGQFGWYVKPEDRDGWQSLALAHPLQPRWARERR